MRIGDFGTADGWLADRVSDRNWIVSTVARPTAK
jgi:hypothetical protein